MHPDLAAAEYEARTTALRLELAERGLAGALLTSEANYNYLAGYHHFAPWTTFCRSVFLFVPTDAGREPVLLVHEFPRADAARDSWLDDVRGYDSLTFAPVDQVASICKELGIRGRIGMELGPEHRVGLSVAEWDALRAALAPADLVDVGEALWSLRIVKSDAEVALLKESGRVAAHAFERCFASLRAGMTEREVAAVLGAAIAEAGGEPGFFIVTSGAGFYDRVAGLPRDRVLEPGDFLWIDLGVVYHGYWTDHCRAAVVGTASAEQRDMWDSVHRLTWSAVQACRPGQRAREVVEHIEAEGARAGLDFSFAAGRSGHGIGLMSTEPPHIALYDDTELTDGMTFTIEPGWIDQRLGVFVAEENLVLRDGGPDLITTTPRALVEL